MNLESILDTAHEAGIHPEWVLTPDYHTASYTYIYTLIQITSLPSEKLLGLNLCGVFTFSPCLCGFTPGAQGCFFFLFISHRHADQANWLL